MVGTVTTFPKMELESKDTFIELIGGPIVFVTVGKDSTHVPLTLCLPQALLSTQSVYLRDRIAELLLHTKIPPEVNPGRPAPTVTPGLAPDLVAISPTSNPHTSSYNLHLNLPEIDPSDFALFVRYIYQGYYPLRPTPAFSHGQTVGPGSKITPGVCVVPIDYIPSPFRAYYLGSILRSRAFQNRAITDVYLGVGTHFSLTPSVIAWIWENNTKDGLPCAMKRLVVDFLTKHWGLTTNHVARFPSLDQGWKEIFTKHEDLMTALIFGCQGRTSLQALTSYYVQVPYVAPVASDTTMRQEPEVRLSNRTLPAPSNRKGAKKLKAKVVIKKEPLATRTPSVVPFLSALAPRQVGTTQLPSNIAQGAYKSAHRLRSSSPTPKVGSPASQSMCMPAKGSSAVSSAPHCSPSTYSHGLSRSPSSSADALSKERLVLPKKRPASPSPISTVHPKQPRVDETALITAQALKPETPASEVKYTSTENGVVDAKSAMGG